MAVCTLLSNLTPSVTMRNKAAFAPHMFTLVNIQPRMLMSIEMFLHVMNTNPGV